METEDKVGGSVPFYIWRLRLPEGHTLSPHTVGCGTHLNHFGPRRGSCCPHCSVIGRKVTQRLSEDTELPSMNAHRPKQGRAIVAVETQIFIDLSFIEGESGSHPGHLHNSINNQPIAGLLVFPSEEGV